MSYFKIFIDEVMKVTRRKTMVMVYYYLVE